MSSWTAHQIQFVVKKFSSHKDFLKTFIRKLLNVHVHVGNERKETLNWRLSFVHLIAFHGRNSLSLYKSWLFMFMYKVSDRNSNVILSLSSLMILLKVF